MLRLATNFSATNKFDRLEIPTDFKFLLFQGGFYFFHLLDRYAAGYSMLFAVFFESIAVAWIYGKVQEWKICYEFPIGVVQNLKT